MTSTRQTHAHTFEVYKGTDRTWGQKIIPPVIFSDEMKNLFNLRVITDDGLFCNVAYVIWEDSDGNRLVVEVGYGDGLERHELFLKANITPDADLGESWQSPSFREKLIVFGQDELNKRLKIQTFVAEVDPLDWRVRYNLGDIVTCMSKRYGLRFDARITHFKEVTENNKTTVILTLGEPEYTVIDELKLM
jgi:hypothetical protein